MKQFLVQLSMLIIVNQASAQTAFVDVSVIPMDQERVLEHQTVLVKDGRIIQTGSKEEVVLPRNTTIIDGRGKFLLPGLVDMHQHIGNNSDALALYLANGITTIRDLNSGPSILDMREKIRAGKVAGPTIVCGPLIAGMPPIYMWMVHLYRFGVVLVVGLLVFVVLKVLLKIFRRHSLSQRITFVYYSAVLTLLAIMAAAFGWVSPDLFLQAVRGDNLTMSPDRAEMLVRKHKAAGYDFIKINWFLDKPIFDKIITTAKELQLPVIGHIPAKVGIEHFVRSGAHPEHQYQLLGFVAKDYVRPLGPNPLDKFDLSEADQKLPDLVKLMGESGVAFTPTLVTYECVSKLFDHIDNMSEAPLVKQPEFQYVPPEFLRHWTDPNNEEFQIVMKAKGISDIRELIPTKAQRLEVMEFSKRMVKAFHKAGIPIFAGTDAIDPGVVWGFALHRELEILVEAGLTPYEALAAATRAPSEFLGGKSKWGTVGQGMQADLLLLNDNPLQNISNTRKISGVMTGGRWMTSDELQQKLDEIAAKYRSQK